MVDLVDVLKKQVGEVRTGDLDGVEAMLFGQAKTLDTMFHNVTRWAFHNKERLDGFERLIRVALKAQAQSRATLETLGRIKNPQPIAYVHQANIAQGHQQVNNSVVAHSGGDFSVPNKVLEFRNEQERLDTRAPSAPVSVDPAVAAVGILNRAEDGKREGTLGS